jgi:Tfp pilus assembly protein PilE
MKNITKDNKGITLVALIITIVITAILGTVTAYTGIDTYKSSKINAFVIEMQLIQSKVDELIETKTMDELLQLGTSLLNATDKTIENYIEAINNGEITSSDVNTYRCFTKDELLQIFDIEDAYSDVVISFETREIVSSKGIEYKGKTYYTQYKLPGGQKVITDSIETTRKPNFAIDLSIDGINANVTIRALKDEEKTSNEADTEFIINGTLKYKELNTNYWQTISNYTEKENTYSINITKSGNYAFRLEDNTNNSNYIEKTIKITLANKPKTNLNLSYDYGQDSDLWAYAEKNGINYVWIPRFANDKIFLANIKFVKGNSNITTENTYLDDKWETNEKFTTSEGVELTGIWVRVDTVNQKGLNMRTLLNSEAETLVEI